MVAASDLVRDTEWGHACALRMVAPNQLRAQLAVDGTLSERP